MSAQDQSQYKREADSAVKLGGPKFDNVLIALTEWSRSIATEAAENAAETVLKRYGVRREKK